MAKKLAAANNTTPQNATKAVSVLANVEKQQSSLYKKEIVNFIMARQDALNIERPRRNTLIELYDDTVMDMFLNGIINNRIVRISNKPFMVIDVETGKPDEVAELMLKKSWFNTWVKLCMESRMYGHSLIYFKEIKNGEVRQVDKVDRRYVVPELQWVLRSLSDEVPMITYTDPEISQFFISCGEPSDLGLLLMAAIGVILKKHSWQNWDEFEEIFGIPIRTATTPGNDKKVLDGIEAWLKKMGSAAYGVFPEGTTLDIKENKSSDAFGVFNEKRKAINEELSVLILGQTMTVLNGSSKSQSETHQKTSDEILEDDLTFVEHLVNDELIPRLISFGYAFKPTHRFAWDTTDALPLTEQWKIDQGLLEKFDIDPEYFQEKYNVPVKLKAVAAPTPDPTNPPTPEPKKKSPSAKMMTKVAKLYAGIQLTVNLSFQSGYANWMGSIEQFIGELHDGKYPAEGLNADLFFDNFDQLAEAAKKGDGKPFLEVRYDAPDYNYRNQVRNNLYAFAGAKTYQSLKAMNDCLLDANGEVVPIGKFKSNIEKYRTEVLGINERYNKNWLQTEYNFALGQSELNRAWQEFEDNADVMPNLRYRTAGDSHVRVSHKALEGIVRPVGDPFWDTHSPKNDWGCRCYLESTEDDTHGDAPDIRIPKEFATNFAKTGTIFSPEHPYFDAPPDKYKAIGEKAAQFVNQRRKEQNQKSWKEYKTAENYNAVRFDYDTGGYLVNHKKAGPIMEGEHEIIQWHLDQGDRVVRAEKVEGDHVKSYDADVNGTPLEWKGAVGSVSSVRNALLGAETQANCVLIRIENYDRNATIEGIKEYARKQKTERLQSILLLVDWKPTMISTRDIKLNQWEQLLP